MTDDNDALHAQVRDWAEGSNPLAAAVELLIRSGLVYEGAPWVRTDNAWKTSAVDFDRLGYDIGALSGGEQRIARIATSLGHGTPVDLREDIAGLDYEHARLVLAAVAHAAGFIEPGTTVQDVDGIPTLTPSDALATWPTE
ncbi:MULTISPECIES: hypothetical protein [Rathayibacter]|uniref:hypothetical protein n=1 Tax=Rathayibacter TaxID=33886 RepID=UPI0006F6A558|nr:MULTISPECIES: hypothetical protein [Rathayibacter]KQP96131.1 hypothetical protein ASF42_18830 [Rathayibacter sp. Leaf294]KQS08557.1 hypothetical protein ASG06_17620 [Rathayibacter sp. Leaf185]MCJ1701966.1 hypothetical protein [Rathayibacter festucae]